MLTLPALTTPRLLVRNVHADDLPDLLVVNDNADVNRFLPYPRWQSLADANAWLERMAGLQAQGDTVQLVVQTRESLRVIGTVLLFRHDPIQRQAELGYALGRAHWGTGVMREALDAVIHAAFARDDIDRLVAVVAPANTASTGLLQRLGFVHDPSGDTETLTRWVLESADMQPLAGHLAGNALSTP